MFNVRIDPFDNDTILIEYKNTDGEIVYISVPKEQLVSLIYSLNNILIGFKG